MEKMKLETPDLTAQNIEKIGALFPNCVTETVDENGKPKKAINFDLLRQMLSSDMVEGDEAYEFTWVGKKAAIVEANKPIRKTLRPCPEESKDWDTTENLYIDGDNLEVLKLLQESYLGKVKMIYIDPPYNTGNDFIYADDFMRSQEEENEQMGMYDEDENRLFKNSDTDGRFHSNWCSMVYSRLMLARNLLSNNGVIFISIDDNEVDNLKKICDEIFGEVNFVATFPWRKRTAKSDVPFGVSQDYEWIACYAKSQEFIARVSGTERKYFETPDFPHRPWRIHDLTKQTTASERPNSYFTIINPKTGDEYPANPNRTWAISKETFEEYYTQNRIVFPGDYPFLNISKPALRYWKEDDMAKAGELFGLMPVWMYPKKVDKCVRIRDKKKQKGKTHMPNKNSPTKYSEEFKKTIVTLYQSGKTYAEIKKEYGVSSSALSNWVRKYSQVQVDEDTVLTAQQIKALQRRNAELEEENLILKKAIAIFTPHSDRD